MDKYLVDYNTLTYYHDKLKDYINNKNYLVLPSTLLYLDTSDSSGTIISKLGGEDNVDALLDALDNSSRAVVGLGSLDTAYGTQYASTPITAITQIDNGLRYLILEGVMKGSWDAPHYLRFTLVQVIATGTWSCVEADVNTPIGSSNGVSFLGYASEHNTQGTAIDLNTLSLGSYVLINDIPSNSQGTVYFKATYKGDVVYGNFSLSDYIYKTIVFDVVETVDDTLESGTLLATYDTLVMDFYGLTFSRGEISLYDDGISIGGGSAVYMPPFWYSMEYDVTGYDSSKTQVLKNINGTLTWVDDSSYVTLTTQDRENLSSILGSDEYIDSDLSEADAVERTDEIIGGNNYE